MQYRDLDSKQKAVFTAIMQDNSYKELVDFCRAWLKRTDSYDATRQGLKLFMSLNDIESPFDVPTKKALVFCVMTMLRLDAEEAVEEAKRKVKEVREGYVRICKQGNQDVLVHKDELKDFLEACYLLS